MSDRRIFIQLASGRCVYPFDLDPADIRIEDIAGSLSQTCRFRGHSRRFYSVAEHCFHVSRDVPPEDALWGLLHDAAEAYLFDVPSPMKPFVAFDIDQDIIPFDEMEARILSQIAFSLGLPGPAIPRSVKEADRRALWWERDMFMTRPELQWGEAAGPAPVSPGLSPQAAEVLFLDRFRELTR